MKEEPSGLFFAARKTNAERRDAESLQPYSQSPGGEGEYFRGTSPGRGRRRIPGWHSQGAGLCGILTSSRGLCLGTRKPDPLMKVLNKRQAPVIVHPTAPAVAAPHVNEELPIPVFAYLKETARAFTNMVLADIFDRYPDIRLLFSTRRRLPSDLIRLLRELCLHAAL